MYNNIIVFTFVYNDVYVLSVLICITLAYIISALDVYILSYIYNTVEKGLLLEFSKLD